MTTIAFGDPKAQKVWSAALFVDIVKKSYFEKKFIGKTDDSIVQRLTDLEQNAGDTISFDLAMQLRNKPTRGDARLEGKEEALKFYTDKVSIDQVRHSVTSGGRMSQKRTVHNLREQAKARLSDYFAKYFDELIFIYLSGARGINLDYTEDLAFAGHGENPIQAPDTLHQMYGGAATSKVTLTAAHKMTRDVIERAQTKATTMRTMDPTTANMMPVQIEGEGRYILLMNSFQEYDLRNGDPSGWIEMNKQLVTAEGKNTPIFRGGLGMMGNVILHSHAGGIRFDDYGASSNIRAGRALFMGRQAGVLAYGSSTGARFDWQEHKKDYENEHTVACGGILGVKKSRFNDRDYGVLSIDTAAADPNP